MRIAVDAMGGDNAPASIVQGAVKAAKEFGYGIVLVGDKSKIKKELSRYSIRSLKIDIEHTDEVIGEKESPSVAFRRKKNASIVVCARLIKEGKAEGMVSAGNSGATMASALATLRRLPGISRPAIASCLPTLNGLCVILDVGANVNCKPRNLLQFAVMGEIYVKSILGKENPTIGLLNIGKEENKGNELALNTFGLLKEHFPNFVGNIEGGGIPRGEADVVVCDGFVGNVILKLTEGVGSVVVQWFRKDLRKKSTLKIVKLLIRGLLAGTKKRMNYDEYGGAPLLGINGACIVCHGVSNSKAIKNSIKVAAKFVEEKVNENIKNMVALDIKNGEKFNGNNRYRFLHT